MFKFIRREPAIKLNQGVVIARQGPQLMLIPLSGQTMRLAVERCEDHSGYRVTARRGEQTFDVLAHCASERQAERLLSKISGHGPRFPAFLVTVFTILLLMFSGWFLFVLPSAPQATAQVSHGVDVLAQEPSLSRAPALVPARPARGVDPAQGAYRPPLIPSKPAMPPDNRPPASQKPAAASSRAFGLSE